MHKRYLQKNVLFAARERMEWLYAHYDHVLVGFSGGKDSTVCLHLAREAGEPAFFCMDYELGHDATEDYIERTFGSATEERYLLKLPVSAQDYTTGEKRFWQPWPDEPKCQPEYVVTESRAEWFKRGTYGRKAREQFCEWFAKNHRGRTVVALGLRCDESLNRLAVLTSKKRKHFVDGKRWIRTTDKVDYAYPIYDWQDSDIWRYIGDVGADYSSFYDIMEVEGVAPKNMRTASPFHKCAVGELYRFKQISPRAWKKMCERMPKVITAAEKRPKKKGVLRWTTELDRL